MANVGARTGGAMRTCIVILFVGLAARAGWGLVSRTGAQGPASLRFPDEQQYWSMAQSLRSGDGLRDELGFRATRMPLYPGYLAMFPDTPAGLRGALIGQWFVGALVGPLVAVTAWTLFRRAAAAWIAGLLVALDPFLVYFASLALTETFFVTVVALVWLMAARFLEPRFRHDEARGGAEGADAASAKPFARAEAFGSEDSMVKRVVDDEPERWGGWIALSVASSLLVYVRESALGLLPLLFGVVARGRRRRGDIVGAALALGVVMLSLAPWALRNKQVIGSWRWLTTRGGISLYDGVRPGATGASDLGDVKSAPEVSGLGEAAWDRWFRERSMEAIASDPARIARLGVVKLARVWNPVPNIEGHGFPAIRWISASWTIPTFTLALIATAILARNGRWSAMGAATFLLLPAIYFSLLHCVFVGSVRYRLGALPGIAVLAAYAVTALVSRAASEERRAASG